MTDSAEKKTIEIRFIRWSRLSGVWPDFCGPRRRRAKATLAGKFDGEQQMFGGPHEGRLGVIFNVPHACRNGPRCTSTTGSAERTQTLRYRARSGHKDSGARGDRKRLAAIVANQNLPQKDVLTRPDRLTARDY
jgi:hypothetical protein